MKKILASLLLGVLALAPVAPAATGDLHFIVELADGSYKEVRFTPTAGTALAFDSSGNLTTATIPAAVTAPRAADVSVTTGTLLAGTGALLGKYTQTVTFNTAFATGVVPEVTIIPNLLVSGGTAVNVTNTGFTMVLPISVTGTVGYIAVLKL